MSGLVLNRVHQCVEIVAILGGMSMFPLPPKGRLTVARRREVLVRVGVELLATRPWDDLTMTEIAGIAEVSKALLYQYFSTKRELYVAAVRAVLDDAREAVGAAEGEAAIAAFVGWAEGDERAFRALLQAAASVDPDVRALVAAARREAVARVVSGPLPAARRIVALGWTGFVGAACLAWLDRRDVPREELVRLLTTALP
jgi:AcrR family transcriptional regulator